MLFLLFVIGTCSAVLIDSREAFTQGSYKFNTGKSWQMIKLYPSYSLPLYKYESFAYPKYEFEYAISDKKTGDHKHHHESRDGDKVRGEYSLVEPDGSLRKVQYDADDHNGFTAIVSKSVHKHGDDAYSVFGQTRYFSPIASGSKTTPNFYPNKNYHYQKVTTNNDNEAAKPVNEKVVDTKNEEKEIPNINLPTDKTTTLEPISMENNEKNVAPAIEEVAIETPDETDQEVLEQVPVQKNEKNNLEVESSSKMPVFEMPLNVLLNEKVEDVNNDKVYKEEPRDDSEGASSYYHSKIYYVGF